jgi:transglutaminase-like putative cysteine protease
MQDAAVERLAKLISDPQKDDGSGGRWRWRRPIEIHIGLAEGWFSLFLVAAVVYSTIWCVQIVGWVEHLNILSLTTVLGLIAGVLAAKQQRFSRALVHVVMLCFGLLLAFWQTAGAFYNGNVGMFAHDVQSWFVTIVRGGSGDNDAIFLFFIVALGFILAYTSAWLVYRTRSPWLMIVANAVVLLINLSAVDAGYAIFLVIFLIASLLLLLRFNLYESIRRWKRQGLRYADDIGWDVMQAGALISIGILVFSWLLPAGYTNPQAATIWTLNSNPWVQAQNVWNRAFAMNGGVNPTNRGNFRETLVLAGNPNLNHDIVFTVQSSDSSQYLASLSYDTYTVERGWISGSLNSFPVKANQAYPSGAVQTHTVQQKITVVNPPGEQYPYLFGASQITSSNLPANVLESQLTGEIVTWLGQNSYLTQGTSYTVVSGVSSADVNILKSVPLPADAPQTLPPSPDLPIPATYYNPAILRVYTQLPKNLDPQITLLAESVTAHEATMYDKMVALETYLRGHYTYSVDVHRPLDQEAVSWFLFRSGNKGFCNYFASAMAVMARTLGIPARVVVGYTNGENDAGHHQRVIRGTDAHAWTQVYFAGYGWINFEPSSSFSTFTRPQPNQFGSAGNSQGAAGASSDNQGLGPNRRNSRLRDNLDNSDIGTATGGQSGSITAQSAGITVGSLILILLFAGILFSIWWNRLFRRYSLATQIYGRICLLASWAGIRLSFSQTPYEYMHELSTATPEAAPNLERLGDIYVRERWADPESMEHPRRSGEMASLPEMWKRVQPLLFLHVLRHPHFLRSLPLQASKFLKGMWYRLRAKRIAEEEEELVHFSEEEM